MFEASFTSLFFSPSFYLIYFRPLTVLLFNLFSFFFFSLLYAPFPDFSIVILICFPPPSFLSLSSRLFFFLSFLHHILFPSFFFLFSIFIFLFTSYSHLPLRFFFLSSFSSSLLSLGLFYPFFSLILVVIVVFLHPSFFLL